jgi:hypothetical protein
MMIQAATPYIAATRTTCRRWSSAKKLLRGPGGGLIGGAGG